MSEAVGRRNLAMYMSGFIDGSKDEYHYEDYPEGTPRKMYIEGWEDGATYYGQAQKRRNP